VPLVTGTADGGEQDTVSFANTTFAPPGGSPGRASSGFRPGKLCLRRGGIRRQRGNGTGTLRRYWGYPLAAIQANPPVGGLNALLAQNVSACGFTYLAGSSERYALVAMNLELTLGHETVSLYHEVHVNNIP